MRCFLAILLLPLFALAQLPFSEKDIAFLGDRNKTDWELRVLANGGAQPSLNTVNAMETLRLGCIAAGLTNKIHSLCVFVPDNLIAATTPLFKHKGSDPWTNVNFGTTNLDINGLKGNGTSKSLDTGVKAKDVVIPANGSTIGMTVIVTESASNASEMVAGQQNADDSRIFALVVSGGGFTQWYPARSAAGEGVLTNDFARVGYVSGSRNTNGGSTNLTIFVASPLESHKAITNLGGSIQALTTTTDETISVFANKHGSTNRQWSLQRMSLAMVNDGFTQTESSNFWVLAKACREQLGGGTGDNIHDWNRKVVSLAGGANVSSTTSNALRTYYSSMDARSLLYKTGSSYLYPPDSSAACRVPVIWHFGSEVATNFNFSDTNVTINGLTGNLTSKSLGTGIRPSVESYGLFSDSSAGISLLIHTAPTSTGGLIEYGIDGTGANSRFSLLHFGATLSFYCWRFINANTDYVVIPAPSPGTNWVGYLSGNRTASNAIRLDYATNVTFVTATNATGTSTGSNDTLTNSFAHALYVSTSLGPANWSDRTISYLSVHPGFTATESSNQWEIVRTYRQAIGGGYP